MKKLLTILIAALMVIPASAQQTERNIIYKVSVGNINYTPKKEKETVGKVLGSLGMAALTKEVTVKTEQPNYVDDARAAIVKGFGNVNRFKVIDGAFVEGDIADGETAYYIDGNITNVFTESKTEIPTDPKQKSYEMFKAHISATINLKDAATDAIVISYTFTAKDYDCSWINSTEGAINNALERLSKYITKKLNAQYPLFANIIERGDNTTSSKEKEVYIDLGTDLGLYKGMTFGVYTVKTIGSKNAYKEIGRLKVHEIMGEDVTLCKVSKGGKDIKNAIDSGVELAVKSL